MIDEFEEQYETRECINIEENKLEYNHIFDIFKIH